MALREKHPNIISPLLSSSSVWSYSEEKGPEKSVADKENVPPVVKQSIRNLSKSNDSNISNKKAQAYDIIGPPSVSRKNLPFASVSQYSSANSSIDQRQNLLLNRRIGVTEYAESPPVNESFHSRGSLYPLEYLGATRTKSKLTSRLPLASLRNKGGDSSKPSFVSNLNFIEVARIGAEKGPSSRDDNFIPIFKTSNDSSKKENFEMSMTREEFVATLKELVASKRPGYLDSAENLLRNMVQDYHAKVSDVAPGGESYNTVIHAYAEAGDPAKAEGLLFLMWKDFEAGNPNAEPNTRVYTSVLSAWHKSGLEEAAEHCEIILERMHYLYATGKATLCKPDLFTYTTCLHCWADSKHPEASNRAEQLFRLMKKRFEAGDDSLKPDKMAYSNLMNAHINNKTTYNRAEDILWEMVDDYRSGNINAKPCTRNFNTVLAMWSKTPWDSEAPERSEELISRLLDLSKAGVLDVQPDKYTYSLLLKTWSVSRRTDGAQRAEDALYWMIDLFDGGVEDACPDIVKFTTVLSAWSHAKRPDKAQNLLNDMIKLYVEGLQSAKPDIKCFNTVLSGWSRMTKCSHAADSAEALLRRMWALCDTNVLNICPDLWSYNTVLFCWRNNCNPHQAEVLLGEMDRLHNLGRLAKSPNVVSFQTVIQTWNASSIPFKGTRINELEREFRKRFPQEPLRLR